MTNHNPSVCARTVPIWLAVAALAAGCHKTAPAGQLVRTDPNVRLVKPERRAIVRTVGCQ